MQTIITYLSLLLSAVLMNAQNTVDVKMTDIKNDRGTIRVGLYNNESDFLDNTYRSLASEINNGEAAVTFTDVPDGTYAISCYHDQDDSGDLNMFFGMFPTEPYGISNNVRGYFGPPEWEDAKFELKGGQKAKFTIEL